MKTFVSPLYIQTNHYTNEKIACALLAASDKGVFFKINTDKIDFAAKLSPDGIKLLAQNAFELIQNKVDSTNIKLSDKQITLFNIKNNFNADYIDYLSKYASGVIQFNSPKPYDIDLNKKTFEDLFEKFIGKEVVHTTINKPFTKKIKKYLSKPELKEKADINYVLNSLTFDGLLKNATISMVTTNGSLDLYQAIDFNVNDKISLAHKLYELIAIKNSVANYAKNKLKMDTYTKLVAIEPTAKSTQKELFDTFYKHNVKTKDVTLIDPEKLEKDIDKIINSKHKKLSELIQDL